MYKNIGKRVFDIIVSCLGLIICSPVFIVVFLMLLIANGGNPFFIQKRPGKNGFIFRIIKFRTMNNRKDKQGNLLSDEKRLTKIGMLIRRSSLDEMPQLLNVLRGEMSLIGPRPLLPEYLPLYNDVQRRRHLARPGITGWAQINGRNAITWKEKFEFDVYYVDNISFLLDLKIMKLTIKKVVLKEDVSSKTSATMERFTGN